MMLILSHMYYCERCREEKQEKKGEGEQMIGRIRDIYNYGIGISILC